MATDPASAAGIVVGVAIVRVGPDGPEVLGARRRQPAGWEFPGGKVEPGESPQAAARREISEELGCAVRVTGWLEGEVPIGTGAVLRVATAELETGVPGLLDAAHDALRWWPLDLLDPADWLDADRRFVRALAVEGGQVPGAD